MPTERSFSESALPLPASHDVGENGLELVAFPAKHSDRHRHGPPLGLLKPVDYVIRRRRAGKLYLLHQLQSFLREEERLRRRTQEAGGQGGKRGGAK